jgi:hypothetical protein
VNTAGWGRVVEIDAEVEVDVEAMGFDLDFEEDAYGGGEMGMISCEEDGVSGEGMVLSRRAWCGSTCAKW